MARRRKGRAVTGILVLDKPVGPSSNGVLQRVRHLFGAAKAGHTGNLDPLASGVLPICLGEATKLSHFLLDADKGYQANISFGVKTSTGDSEGDVISRASAETLDAEYLDDYRNGEDGRQERLLGRSTAGRHFLRGRHRRGLAESNSCDGRPQYSVPLRARGNRRTSG